MYIIISNRLSLALLSTSLFNWIALFHSMKIIWILNPICNFFNITLVMNDLNMILEKRYIWHFQLTVITRKWALTLCLSTSVTLVTNIILSIYSFMIRIFMLSDSTFDRRFIITFIASPFNFYNNTIFLTLWNIRI